MNEKEKSELTKEETTLEQKVEQKDNTNNISNENNTSFSSMQDESNKVENNSTNFTTSDKDSRIESFSENNINNSENTIVNNGNNEQNLNKVVNTIDDNDSLIESRQENSYSKNSNENDKQEKENEIIFNKKENNFKISKVGPYVISLLALVIAISSIVTPNNDKVVLYTSNNSNQTVSTSTSTSGSMTNVVSSVINTVVEVKSEIPTNTLFGTSIGQSSGSGVIVSEDGYITTNHHVVDGASKITVTLSNGQAYDAKVIGSDPANDISVIKIEEKGLQAITFADSSLAQPGDQVFAIGNPTGELGGSVTFGYVSATSRYVTIENVQYAAIQHDAAVSPGSSGGGLFNTNGELLGIVSAKTVSTEIEGIGFAIPSNETKNIVSDIIEYGYVKKPVIGITVLSITNEQAAIYNRVDDLGIYIQSVALNSDANKKGLLSGDLIYEIDGNKIVNSNDIQKILKTKEIGDSIKITVKRNGTYMDFDVTLIDSVN